MSATGPGFFVTFEGIDGAGKSTQLAMLEQALSARHAVLKVHEPGATVLGEAVRTLLLGSGDPTPAAEALLYAGARAELCARVIAPALSEGKVVLCDRFIDSSLAYQGYGRGLGVEPVAAINAFAAGELHPHLTFLFDLPVTDAARRLGCKPDRIEALESGFHEKVRQGFLEIAHTHPERIVVLDGGADPGETHKQVLDCFTRRYNQREG